MSKNVTPYEEDNRSKKDQVADMFDKIAPSYDFLNHSLSMGADILWRRKAIKALKAYNPKVVLDVATGTADFAIEALRLDPDKVIGIDISNNMLNVGRKKIDKLQKSGKVTLEYGDCEDLQFEDESIDAITVGFGVRNFQNLEKGLSEMHRVLKKGKAAVILEPAIPTRFPMKQLFHLYFKVLLPTLGKLVSKHQSAYTYLPESVSNFPNGAKFVEICNKIGFYEAKYTPLTFGICSMYILRK